MWQAMSPRAPQPKSHQPRQLKGAYFALYSRMGAGPIHRSQSNVAGTGSPGRGAAMPWGQIGRLLQVWTLVTSPMAPDQIISQRSRTPWPELP